jgi:hypothetical protein
VSGLRWQFVFTPLSQLVYGFFRWLTDDDGLL